jgi:5'-nucleotidase
MTLIERIQKERLPVLQLDSGDLFLKQDSSPETEGAKRDALIIAKVYRWMGVNAINVGEWDIPMGIEFLEEEFRKGLPLISSNILSKKERKELFIPYIVKEVSGIRFGIFGICKPISGISNRSLSQEIFLDDPYKRARQMVEELKGKVDIIICLSNLGKKGDERLVMEVKGIHFIFGGNDGLLLKEPLRCENTFIFQHYRKGMYAGRIDLRIVDRDLSFEDSGLLERLEKELEGVNERIRYTEGLKKSSVIDRYLKGLYQKKSELEGKLAEAKMNPPKGSIFLHRVIPLGEEFSDHREWKSILSTQK